MRGVTAARIPWPAKLLRPARSSRDKRKPSAIDGRHASASESDSVSSGRTTALRRIAVFRCVLFGRRLSLFAGKWLERLQPAAIPVYTKEALDRAQMYCAPPAPTKTDSATAQLAANLNLKFEVFIATFLVCCALVTVRFLLLVGISPSCRMTVLSVCCIC